VDIAPPGERTEQFGRYRVTINAGGIEQVLTYAVELSPGRPSITWKPSDSILSDSRIDVLVVVRLNDIVVAFHRGEEVHLPHEIPSTPAGPETVVVRL
jgi:hypothetical protein